MKRFTVLVITALMLASCGKKETLKPLVEPMTVNELKKDKPILFSYMVDDTQIDEYAKNTGKFPIFGKLFQAIAIVLANSTINTSGGHELELGSVDIDLSTLSAIDFNLISYINFDSLVLFVKNAKSRDSLNFIDKFEIHARLDSPIPGLEVDKNGFSKLVYFNRAEDKMGCDGRCIQFHIAKIDWKQLLATNKLVHIQPKLTINSVPLSTMKLAGSIEFSIKSALKF